MDRGVCTAEGNRNEDSIDMEDTLRYLLFKAHEGLFLQTGRKFLYEKDEVPMTTGLVLESFGKMPDSLSRIQSIGRGTREVPHIDIRNMFDDDDLIIYP